MFAFVVAGGVMVRGSHGGIDREIFESARLRINPKCPNSGFLKRIWRAIRGQQSKWAEGGEGAPSILPAPTFDLAAALGDALGL